ncbi:universal stress protein [Natronorarus salvus]|uniref:universal stress protein n=1 Tax=Natronorarus salvus TaxID=3117733 RepID=UPI002F265E60
MARTILVPVDESIQARAAFEFAVSEYADDRLVLVHVVDPIDAIYVSEPSVWNETMIDRRRERAETLLADLGAIAGEAGVAVETAIERGDPSRAILAAAADTDADLIVMGSHGRSGVSRVLLGSVAETVARRSPIPVTIVR